MSDPFNDAANEAIIKIEQATRAGTRLLIQLFGPPQSGKTETALLLARGMAGPNGKVGGLCTESGRMRLYSDKIPGGFYVGELTPPFTPARYMKAIEAFIEFGVNILVIDSFSHVWEGTGGVLEQADRNEANGKVGKLKWQTPKTEYRKMRSYLLSNKIHIIFCSRAKQPLEEIIENGRKKWVKLPWVPIQDPLLQYEMTMVVPMISRGTYETDIASGRLKVPGDLVPIFSSGRPLGVADGEAIAAWVAGGVPVNNQHELLRKRAGDAAEDGTEAFRAFWGNLSKADRDVLRGGLANYQSIAAAADEQRAAERDGTKIEGVGGQRDGEEEDDPFPPRDESSSSDQTSNQAALDPIRIPITLTTDNRPDWPTFANKALAAIASAPDASWLSKWVEVHAAVLPNLEANDPAAHQRVVAELSFRQDALSNKAA